MGKFVIYGGRPLRGTVRVGGAKNAGFKLMIAAALGEKESRLLNLSYINDVEVTRLALKQLGIRVRECGERSFSIKPEKLKTVKLPQFTGKKSRGSTLFASLFLAKQGEAIIPLPGGCVLGPRPIDRHLLGLQALGAKINYQGNYIRLTCNRLKGANFSFPKKTHTGTEAIILLAVKAKGRTVIKNAGQEPEIDDLILFLNKMGAKIKRASEDRIIIDGVAKLKGAVHQVMPDRNEAVSYAIAALATKGDVVLENARRKDMKIFLKKLDEIGASYELSRFGIRFWYKKRLKATKLYTAPAPGFMTDWQPLWTVLMTQAQGTSKIIERVHNNRFQFVAQLNQMGAKINLFNPKVKDSKKYYEFDEEKINSNFHAVQVCGPTPLKGADLKVTDLRAGATLVIAALIAKGKSILTEIDHIDRGYEKLDDKLRQLGARIKRI